MKNEERINGLETQVRTLKRIVYGFGCLLVAGLVVGAIHPQPVPDLIQAKKFEVVNSKGERCVELTSQFDGGAMNIYDHNGDWSILMSSVPNTLNPEGAPHPKFYMFSGGFGGKGIEMGVSKENGGKIETTTLSAEQAISTNAMIATKCVLLNANRVPVCAIGADNAGDGTIRIFNKKGEITSSLP